MNFKLTGYVSKLTQIQVAMYVAICCDYSAHKHYVLASYYQGGKLWQKVAHTST